MSGLLDGMISGNGCSVFVSGDAGIGKTRLIEELCDIAESKGARLLKSSAEADALHPFLLISRALEGVIDCPLFEEQEFMSFAEIFVINYAGMLLAQASSEDGELDGDIFTGMFSAVQDFVSDSLDSNWKMKAGLGRLEYGDMKILIEHGQHIFLTTVIKGSENPDMKRALKQAVADIETKYGKIIENWVGTMEEMRPVEEEVSMLSGMKFLVRRDMEGLKLENERIRIADLVLGELASLASEKPLICVLEDLHWADESTLFVLNYLARNLKNNKVMFLCTFRPDEPGPLSKIMAEMKDEGLIMELALKRLEHAEAIELLDSICSPNGFSGEFKENLAVRCEGNAFFVVEIIIQMLEDGSMERRNGNYVLTREDFAIPGSVEEIIHQRLEMLEPDSMAIAEYASCIGREFETNAALSLPSLRDPPAAFESLRTSGMVVASNGSAEFRQAIFQQQIYENIGSRWKIVYHKSLGEYYEAAYKGRETDVLYELAKHFSRSTEHSKAFDYCFRAGEMAEGAFAAELAIDFYEKSLDALPRLRMIDAASSGIEILGRLGDLHLLTSQFEKAIDYYSMAIDREEVAERKADIHGKITGVYEKMGEFDKGLAESDSGMKLMEDEESVITARLLNNKGAIYNKIGEHSKAREYLLESLRIAEKFDDRKAIAKALHNLGNAHLYTSEYDTALDYLHRALGIMEGAGDIFDAAKVLSNIGVIHHSRGELDRAEENYNKCLELFNKIGDKYGVSLVYNNIGNLYEYRGDLDKELEYYEKSLEIKRSIGDKQGIALALMNIGCIHDDRGNLAKALEHFEKSLEISSALGDKPDMAQVQNNIGDIHRNQGDLDKAEECYKKAEKMFTDIGDKANLGMSLTNIGLIARLKGNPDKAIRLEEKSLAIAEEIDDKWLRINNYLAMAEALLDKSEIEKAREKAEIALGIAVEAESAGEEGMSRRVLGMVLRETGRLDDAREELDRALKIHQGTAQKADIGKVFYERSLLHAKMNEPDKAKEDREKARQIFEEMGMRLWLGKVKL